MIRRPLSFPPEPPWSMMMYEGNTIMLWFFRDRLMDAENRIPL